MAAESWLDVPPESDFSLDNVPFGICSFESSVAGSTLAPSAPRCCTAIGNHVVDLHLLAEAGLLDELRTADSKENEAVNSNEGGEGGSPIEFHPRVVFGQTTLNSFMSHARPTWVAVRDRLISLFLSEPRESHLGAALTPDGRLRDNPALRSAAIQPVERATFHLPASIGDYTDFYSSREHATNVGIMFRGKDNALQPNWLHMPIGYHGRSSTVYPSLSRPGIDSDSNGDRGETAGRTRRQPMATVRRPCGQLQADPSDPSRGSTYGPTRLLDFELEVAFLLGGPTNSRGQLNEPGRPLTVDEARDRIFGYLLMNDWSARDVQKWEYVPLGPFGSKNFATTVSTWVVTPMALDAFRCRTSAGSQGGPRTGEGGGGTELSEGIDVGGSSAGDDPTPLEYLRDSRYGSYDVELTVDIRPSPSSRAASTTVCQTNLSNLYWTPAQQLAHHSVTGCAMRPGDLLASGTISGRGRESFGSLLELSWKGTRPVELGDGSSRTFLEDGDEVIMRGWCEARSGLVGRVGFGECSARVLPADPYPYESAGPICDNTIGSSEIRYEDLKVRSSSGSTSLLRVRVALAAKRLEDVEELPQEDGRGGGDQPSEIVLTFRDAQSSEAHRIEGSLAIIEFLDVWNQGGRLIPTEPVTRARMREVVFLLDSIDADVTALANDNVPASSPAIVGRIKSRLATVEGTLTGLRGDASFAIGTFGPTLADVCLLPTLVGVRGRQGLGIDLASYPTLMKVEDACRCHPWFCTTGP